MSKSGLQTLPKVRRSTKEVESMKDERIYLLAELTILPEFLEEVKAILRRLLSRHSRSQVAKPYTRPGETMILTSWSSSRSSPLRPAHEFHLEQDYTKRLFASLDGKVSGVPTLTKLSPL